jgi:hypothetical protein
VAVISRIEDDATVVHRVAVQVVVVTERRANRSRVLIFEVEPHIQRRIVEGEVRRVPERWRVVVCRLGLVPRGNRRDVVPRGFVEHAVDGDGTREPRDADGLTGAPRGRLREDTSGQQRQAERECDVQAASHDHR